MIVYVLVCPQSPSLLTAYATEKNMVSLQEQFHKMYHRNIMKWLHIGNLDKLHQKAWVVVAKHHCLISLSSLVWWGLLAYDETVYSGNRHLVKNCAALLHGTEQYCCALCITAGHLIISTGQLSCGSIHSVTLFFLYTVCLLFFLFSDLKYLE